MSVNPPMSTFLLQEQIDLATGDLLGSSKKAGLADHIAASYFQPRTSAGDNLESESDSDSDSDYSLLNPQMGPQSLEWKSTFEQCA